MITKSNQTMRVADFSLCPGNQQGRVRTHHLIFFLAVASGLLNACNDSSTITQSAPPGFDETFFRSYPTVHPARIVPNGILPDSVSIPSNVPDSSWLMLRNNNTYALMSKSFVTVRRGSATDTLVYRINEEGELLVESAYYHHGEGGIGWNGNVKFTPVNGTPWECRYDLFDSGTDWALYLWGPIWLPDSSYITCLIARHP